MPERNPNILLSDAAAPVAGIQDGNVVMWYGGPFNATFAGAFDGATITLLMPTKLPALGKALDAEGAPTIAPTDWADIADISDPGVFTLANLNPCLLTVKVATPGVNTRVRVTVG